MNVEEFLASSNVSFQTHEHPPAYTAQEVAAEEHVSGNLMAKTVVVRANRGHAMCVLPASCKLDMTKVARVLKVKKVRLADEAELGKLFPDVEVGAEPPFGHLYDVPTLVDSRLAAGDEIVFQAGSHRRVVRMKYADYARLALPTVADLGVHL